MAVPSSGQLRLRGDIALEVYGVATGANISLRSMSSDSGFSVPDNMSEFYGYANQTVPSVTTNAMSVGETTATLSGNVTDDGNATITERGFYFGTNSASPTNNTKYVVSGTTGTYTNNRTGLTTETTYYCWAYATNAVGTTYGARVQATTLAVFVPTYATSMFGTSTLRPSNVYGGEIQGVYRLQYLNPNTSTYIEYSVSSLSASGYSGTQTPAKSLVKNAANRFFREVNQTGGSGGLRGNINNWRSCGAERFNTLALGGVSPPSYFPAYPRSISSPQGNQVLSSLWCWYNPSPDPFNPYPPTPPANFCETFCIS